MKNFRALWCEKLCKEFNCTCKRMQSCVTSFPIKLYQNTLRNLPAVKITHWCFSTLKSEARNCKWSSVIAVHVCANQLHHRFKYTPYEPEYIYGRDIYLSLNISLFVWSISKVMYTVIIVLVSLQLTVSEEILGRGAKIVHCWKNEQCQHLFNSRDHFCHKNRCLSDQGIEDILRIG